MIPFRDDSCPARGPGLGHYAEHPDFVCADCYQQCLIESVEVEVEGVMFLVDIGEKECLLDHEVLVGGRTVGSTDWVRCFQCGVRVEPKTRSDAGLPGPPYGPGRTGSPRAQVQDESRWSFLAWHFARIEP